MGYSSRYHAASLAAVFVALAVGILIGAALGSDVVSGTADSLESDLAEDLDRLREENADLQDDLDATNSFDEQVYPAVVGGRLSGESVALIAFGDVDAGALKDDAEQALNASGADLAEVASVREPPDVEALAEAVLPASSQFQPSDETLAAAAEQAGRALVGRGQSFEGVRSELLSGFSGDPSDITSVILVREPPEDLPPRAADEVAILEEGIVKGMTGANVRVVGAEREDADPSSIDFFDDLELTSVDNINTYPGRVALVLALQGADGRFGSKDTADGLLPELVDPSAPEG